MTPHRFLTSHPKHDTSPPAPKFQKPSNKRSASPPSTQNARLFQKRAVEETVPQPPPFLRSTQPKRLSEQFTSTPRFASNKEEKREVVNAFRTSTQAEGVDEDAEMLLTTTPLHTTLPFSPKRPRLAFEDDISPIHRSVSPTQETVSDELISPKPYPPQTPIPFHLQPSQSSRALFKHTESTHPEPSSRVLFKPPSHPPPPPITDAFSPRKRGRLVPGGMAATVQTFILDAPYHSHEEVVFKVRQVERGPPHFIRTMDGRGVLLVAGRVEIGDWVELKPPTWDVEVNGEGWIVGVEYTIQGGKMTIVDGYRIPEGREIHNGER
ncbi:hypothetical protein K470DRAFT_277621 [Piedraia hortae CBS 480.64]|uniref:Uncharacterized protein n=1 Tax=Piedraia hortae CBS 480.64 TaxID=1314780 RepID=A0A6A7BW26_9PEZI|nr:hypothetical protein K470DRAFT_277621 [Piedraia hortae CBS 480.64]